MRFHRTTTLILLGSIALFGCKKKEEAPPPETVTPTPVETPAAVPTPVPFRVTTIDLGKAVDADKKITEPATTFAPKDTIYAAVSSEGEAPSVKLQAKWTFGDKGTSVKDDEVTITPIGPATTDFSISKPSGWPVGKYKVEILADGVSAGTKDFEVKK
jgi:hypothetical protein